MPSSSAMLLEQRLLRGILGRLGIDRALARAIGEPAQPVVQPRPGFARAASANTSAHTRARAAVDS